MLFYDTYIEAREAFNRTAKDNGYIRERFHYDGVKGVNGEALSIDVAVKGEGNVLALTSGLHGVEGYTGSACQLDFMQNIEVKGFRALLIHAINPYGFSHKSRTNEFGVDLNRNCGPLFPHHFNTDYDRVQLKIDNWVSSTHSLRVGDVQALVDDIVSAVPSDKFLEIVSSGQYRYPMGLFYGGSERQQSFLILDKILKKYALPDTQFALFLDVHTGLGEPGYGELIYTGSSTDTQYELIKSYLDEVTCPSEGNSISGTVMGSAENYFQNSDIAESVAYVALEYGTKPPLEVLAALISDIWLRSNVEAEQVNFNLVQERMFEAFCGKTDDWRDLVVSRSRDVSNMAITMLRSMRGS